MDKGFHAIPIAIGTQKKEK